MILIMVAVVAGVLFAYNKFPKIRQLLGATA